MKKTYLILSVLGFIAPNIFVAQESIDSGNVLLWLDPLATLQGMFANRIATAFVVDLLVAVGVFFAWTATEAKKHGIKQVRIIWILTLLFGMAGTLPLFLYLREKQRPHEPA